MVIKFTANCLAHWGIVVAAWLLCAVGVVACSQQTGTDASTSPTVTTAKQASNATSANSSSATSAQSSKDSATAQSAGSNTTPAGAATTSTPAATSVKTTTATTPAAGTSTGTAASPANSVITASTGANGTISTTNNTPAGTTVQSPSVPVAVCPVPARFYCLEFFLPQANAQAMSQYQSSCQQQAGTYAVNGVCPTANVVGTCTMVINGSGMAVVYYSINGAAMQASCTSQQGVWTRP